MPVLEPITLRLNPLSFSFPPSLISWAQTSLTAIHSHPSMATLNQVKPLMGKDFPPHLILSRQRRPTRPAMTRQRKFFKHSLHVAVESERIDARSEMEAQKEIQVICFQRSQMLDNLDRPLKWWCSRKNSFDTVSLAGWLSLGLALWRRWQRRQMWQRQKRVENKKKSLLYDFLVSLKSQVWRVSFCLHRVFLLFSASRLPIQTLGKSFQHCQLTLGGWSAIVGCHWPWQPWG